MKLILVLALAGALHAQYSMFPAVRGTKEMVGAANNFEVEAGYRILQQGGNAVDAGVAAILAACVTDQDEWPTGAGAEWRGDGSGEGDGGVLQEASGGSVGAR
jgi:isoaspartyl peptidase/L-asparaginase-like protein (Ntn-hydrolase superfamily)